MNVTEVTNTFRAWANENDERWFNSWVPTTLAASYNQFRAKVIETIPMYYAARVTFTASGKSHDMTSGASSILGASPSNAKLSRLVGVWTSESGQLRCLLSQAANGRADSRSDFWQEGSTLRFKCDRTGEHTIIYVPQSTVDWTQNASGDTEYIDDLDEYHELIAIYAMERFGIRSGSRQNVARVRQDMEDRLDDHLTSVMGDSGRSITYASF